MVQDKRINAMNVTGGKKSYMKKTGLTLSLMFLLAGVFAQNANPGCIPYYKNFEVGEKIKYVLTYNWFMVWTDVGEVTFEVNETMKNKRNTYHLIGKGKTYKFYDWFYEVRDIYETWVDRETLKPYYYKRDVNEGGYEIDIIYQYDWEDSLAYAQSKKTRKPFKRDTIPLSGCTHDIMSIIYYARTIKFSNYEIGEKIPLTLLLDSKIEPVYIRYQGKEVKKVRGMGKFNCIKFSGYLVPGDVFKGGEDLEVWVTDDKNRVPVWIESPIKVGKIKARMIDYKGLKYELSSQID
jgi:hypothetical protein